MSNFPAFGKKDEKNIIIKSVMCEMCMAATVYVRSLIPFDGCSHT